MDDTHRFYWTLLRVVLAGMCFLPALQVQAIPGQGAGILQNGPGAFGGYTLYHPLGSKTTYLIDMEGRVVNQWVGRYEGHTVELLENGHLLRLGSLAQKHPIFAKGGAAGSVQEFTWDGEVIWDFQYSGDDYLSHHDLTSLPNGNVLMIAYERKSKAEAIAAGRAEHLVGEQGLWPDHIIEVKPTGKTTGRIVWEWHVWDHLIQDVDSRRENYGVVADHPELINLNPGDWQEQMTPRERKNLESLGYIGPSKPNKKDMNPDWNHINAIAYHAEFDQIVLSVLGFNELWVIDHSTNRQEAAGHSGGRSGKGGDLLYRWGNPLSYSRGSKNDQTLFAQHDVHWIGPNLPGAGHLLIFNNGRGRSDGNYSSVDEIGPPVDAQGRYHLSAGKPFGPEAHLWTYAAAKKSDFFSMIVSGAQRLGNGNTLICSGTWGLIFEVTPAGEIVWKYRNPLRGKPGPRQDRRHMVFQAQRYAPDYPGLAGQDLTPGKTIEESIAPNSADASPAHGQSFR